MIHALLAAHLCLRARDSISLSLSLFAHKWMETSNLERLRSLLLGGDGNLFGDDRLFFFITCVYVCEGVCACVGG